MHNNLRAFLQIKQRKAVNENVEQRIKHFNEFTTLQKKKELQEQASRCMSCGVPFCHVSCPVHNQIPDWNQLVTNGDWKLALQDLHITNNFPEFTGRICPAPCESSCTLNLTDEPVTIKNIELAIVEKGFTNGWIKPQKPQNDTKCKIAIVGSGVAGLAAAQDLRRKGHNVEVFEKNRKIGGLLRYGIPDFKLEKKIIDRRMQQLVQEGIVFKCGQEVGRDISFEKLKQDFDAVLLACGIEEPRDIKIKGRQLKGVHFAMEYLVQQGKKNSNEQLDGEFITAKGKNIVVIGGGDTGSDCIGTANRQKVKSITQFVIQPCPPDKENKMLEWPYWPLKLRTSTSQEEGADTQYELLTLEFVGDHNNNVKKILCAKADENRRPIKGTHFQIDAELVLIAIGYQRPVLRGFLEKSKIKLDQKGLVIADYENFQTSEDNVYVAGDMRRGQSLTVWAIMEGKKAAIAIHKNLRKINKTKKI